jgi:hypothetical protein
MTRKPKKFRGEPSHLTPEDRLAIRICRVIYSPVMRHEDIAEAFGVTRQTVHNLTTRIGLDKLELALNPAEFRSRAMALYVVEKRAQGPVPASVWEEAYRRASDAQAAFVSTVLMQIGKSLDIEEIVQELQKSTNLKKLLKELSKELGHA